jgi:hypothetical protein
VYLTVTDSYELFMMKADTGRTPRKRSTDSYKQRYCDKLRSNSSFKKPREDDNSMSPSPMYDRSRSKPGKSVGRIIRVRSKEDFDYPVLSRQCTKHSDVLPFTRGSSKDQEMFFTQLNSSHNTNLQTRFDSKETYSLTKSVTTVVFSINQERIISEWDESSARNSHFLLGN